MGSEYLSLTDDQLLEKLALIGSGAMISTWQDKETGLFEAGLRHPLRGVALPLSRHHNEAAAIKAAKELETRLDRLATERPELSVQNLMDDAGDGTGETHH